MYQSKQQRFPVNERDGEYRFHPAHKFRGQVTVRANLDAITRIQSSLNMTQREIFRGTCFGQFLSMREHRNSSILMHSMLFRLINRGDRRRELWFRVNGVDIRFSPIEFALVTGLIFGDNTDITSYVNISGIPRLRRQYFPRVGSINYTDMKAAIERRCWGDDDEDGVKLAVLYFAHNALLGADTKKVIQDRFVHLADDLDAFSRYPWGTIVWNATTESMWRAIHTRYEHMMNNYPSFLPVPPSINYPIRGYAMGFQFWIYEALGNLDNFIENLGVDRIPRMLKWRTLSIPTWEHESMIMDALSDVLSHVLLPTLLERETEYFLRVVSWMGADKDYEIVEEAHVAPTYQSPPHGGQFPWVSPPVGTSTYPHVWDPPFTPTPPISTQLAQQFTSPHGSPCVHTSPTPQFMSPHISPHIHASSAQQFISPHIQPSSAHQVRSPQCSSYSPTQHSFAGPSESYVTMDRLQQMLAEQATTMQNRIDQGLSSITNQVNLLRTELDKNMYQMDMHLKAIESSCQSTPIGLLQLQELESEICKFGCRIKKHEMAMEVVNDQMTEVEQVLSQLQASTEPHILSDPHRFTKEEMLRQIQSKGHSASAVLCCVGKEVPLHESRADFMEDIVGVVSLIGKAWTRNLSRMLAEYLGEDQMLALVCRSFRAACAFEEYERNGEVDFSLGLHGKAAAHGKSIVGRFLVICLEDIRPYTGELDVSDPQRRLVLRDPILPCGNDPPGFMGYAVNMVDLDELHVYTRTDAGHGLRETLFYRLFGELQVYRTREDMIEARACIKQGAISLDGGILKENGFISLGHGNPTICFPVVGHVELLPSSASVEKLNQIKQKKSELGELSFLKEKYTKALEKAFKKFNNKKEKYKQHMDEISPKLRDYLEYGKSKKQ